MSKYGLPDLVRFAKNLGIEVQLGTETEYKTIPKTVRWVGPRRIVRGRSVMTLKITVDQLTSSSLPDIVINDLAHELGHFIAAPKGRRCKIDYGIKTKSKFAELDEFKANFVEIAIQQALDRRTYVFSQRQKNFPEYKQAEEWWRSEGQIMVKTLLEFLMLG